MFAIESELPDYVERAVLISAPHVQHDISYIDRRQGTIELGASTAAWLLWSDGILHLAESVIYSYSIPNVILFEKLQKKDSSTYEGIVRLLIMNMPFEYLQRIDVHIFKAIFSSQKPERGVIYLNYILNKTKTTRIFSRIFRNFKYMNREMHETNVIYNVNINVSPRFPPLRIVHLNKVYDIKMKIDKRRDIFYGGPNASSVVAFATDLPKVLKLIKEINPNRGVIGLLENEKVEEIKKYFPEYFS